MVRKKVECLGGPLDGMMLRMDREQWVYWIEEEKTYHRYTLAAYPYDERQHQPTKRKRKDVKELIYLHEGVFNVQGEQVSHWITEEEEQEKDGQ